MSEKETDKNSGKSDIAKREEEILKFWQENEIFEKTLKQTEGKEEFVFYDGPPFATGTPHYGHILAGTIKDAIPRYQTMKGKYVKRRWGWDCHGLPAENLVEKKLELKSKKDIEDYGISLFNEEARAMVLEYVGDWKKIVPRLGRFVDMENDYRTMDWYYTESVMWIFKTLHDKGLIYEGYKSMQICPRCETTLSNFEVNQGYKDVQDISVTVKFELADEPGTFVLAWTTTPWTLPGNVALAVNPEITYVKVKVQGADQPGIFIAAQERIASVFDGKDYELIGEVKGSELIGRSYKPAFDYYVNDETIKNRENGWKIYGADFVTTEDGTGVVHIAPAFGEDDMKLGQKENLPFIQHVKMNGHFKPEVRDWPDVPVKPIDDPQKTDILVLKNLAAKGILFSKEKITHSYPHCWRCHTPLLNYATSSWFVEVTKFKDELVANNKQIDWIPEHIKEGRFGKWLEGARDWAISRSRFWGAPIPVWKCESCKKMKVVGTIEDLKDSLNDHHNNYWLMRHGEAVNNLTDQINSLIDNNIYPLTEEGRRQAKESAQKLKGKNIDYIFSSDFARTRETAEIVAEEIGFPKEQIAFDDRLREFQISPSSEGETWKEANKKFNSKLDKLFNGLPGGESGLSVKKRVGEFLYELNDKYQGKNILILSHGMPLFFMLKVTEGKNPRELVTEKDWGCRFETAEIKELPFKPLPHNWNYDLDLHRPYIDDVELPCACGGAMRRVPEVFDCWFESGSMPYAQAHYPFEKDHFDPEKNIGFPADFIAEGLDQTRGWFYSMLVLSTALFDKTSYKNVIVNGIVLAEDGQKMSKSLKNYPDPMMMVDKFGADALRFYLLSSPLMRAEDLNFSEKSLGETYRKIIMRLSNVLSFYEMYAPKEVAAISESSKNILDVWIMARFNQLVKQVDEAMEKYELDRASRPIDEFIDDLSNWYVRRSRDRFKSEDLQDRNWAVYTTREILIGLAKVMAPFTPFVAEEVYRRLAGEGKKDSVHLASWPEAKEYDIHVIEEMAKAREFVEIGLALRDRKGIKVRQPLSEFLFYAGQKLDDELKILEDELNVKKAVSGPFVDLPAEKYEIFLNEKGEPLAALNFEITNDLREEGNLRELVRFIQDERKKAGLNPGEEVSLSVETDAAGQSLISKFESDIRRQTNLRAIVMETNGGREIKIDDLTFKLQISK